MTNTSTDLTLDSAMLCVHAVPESVAFYQKLGFDLTDEIDGVAIVTAPGGGHLKLHPLPDNGSTGAEGINLYFTVGDVDMHLDHACNAGVEFDFPPTTMSWGARHSYVTDPRRPHHQLRPTTGLISFRARCPARAISATFISVIAPCGAGVSERALVTTAPVVKFAPDADLHAVCAAPAGFGVGPPTAPAPRL